MKRFFVCFAVLTAMFFFAACSGGSKETVYDNTDSGSQSGEKNDSDNGDSQGDTTPDNGNSQHEETDSSDSVDDSGDTTPDNGNTSEPTDDADSSDPVSDDDSDTTHENDIEIGETKEADCTGLPANASWNSVSSITQTWNGTEWVPSTDATFSTTASTTKCRFVCNQNYSWNDSECVAETRNANCEGLPENAVWNSASSIIQTWDDENWVPASTGTYNTNSSTSECRFKCAQNYNWTGSQCVVATQPADCIGLPENALWNTVSNITQTWSGTSWVPTNAGSFNETPSYSECHFICKTNYTWNGVSCAPNEMNAVACTGKPANAVWNTVPSITQTWNGTEWTPTTSATFNETPSTTECRFKCADNYEWNNSQCAAKSREVNCIALPTNAQWNTATTITQTWDGNAWIPTNIGSFNSSESSSECYFKCNEHYTWNNTICTADQQPATCTGLPANAQWNSVSEITQTWNGNGWTPSTAGTYNTSASTSECRFKCNENYNWDSSTSTCIAATKPASCTGLPANASWNTASSITQTWDGHDWMPSNAGTYNTTASSTECRFKCNKHYSWKDSQCVADTQDVNCTGLPTNAEWNTASSITQTWNGSAWAPTTTGSYNIEPSTTECRYKCTTDYHWENSACVSNTKNSGCTGLPANAEWNTATSITQNWNGSEWTPSTTGTYSATASTAECRFKCNEHYSWKNSQCVADTQNVNCTGLPSNAVWNTVESITQTWSGTGWFPTNIGTYDETASDSECRFKCSADYHWENPACVSNTKTNVACSEIPENAEWNSVSSITQTWDGNEWIPSTESVFDEEESENECRFKCNSAYTWEDDACINQKTASCTGKPANSTWNTASSITQTWNGTSWTPSTTGTYNETASTTQCRFKCNSSYHWENSTCTSNTRTANCTGLPTGGVWNTASSITQTWDGSSWNPSTTGVYNTTASTTACRYKCGTNYSWNQSSQTCKPDSKVSNCTGLPTNAVWNTVSTISQTWNGSSWQPTTTASYNTTASTSYCRFKCSNYYEWNGSKCEINTGSLPGVLGRICTGQTKCYNDTQQISCPSSASADFYGQDAQYAALGYCIPQSFSLEGTEASQMIVVDNNTGLEWQQTFPTSNYTWEDAKTYCNNLTYAGKNDWRLPTPQELLTIVDNNKQIPAINTNYFPNTPSDSTVSSIGKHSFWSSAVSVSDPQKAFGIYTKYGTIQTHAKAYATDSNGQARHVRCVRGSTLPLASFSEPTSINGQIVITDLTTGLMWQKTYATDKTGQEALSYCENLTYAGYSDWRLPNKNELASLINYNKKEPASDFPDMPYEDDFASSTTCYFNSAGTFRSDRLYNADFKDATVNSSLKYYCTVGDTHTCNYHYVRCVRN